jgi:hypothetical protein
LRGSLHEYQGRKTTADRTNYRQDYNQGLSVNGNLDEFNYYASLNSTEQQEFLKQRLLHQLRMNQIVSE